MIPDISIGAMFECSRYMNHLSFLTAKPALVLMHLLFSTGVLERSLEKKAGRNYAPPGMKKLINFIDDLNMPEVDAYGTVQPHTLIRQHLDYGHW